MIEQNVKHLFEILPQKNVFWEKITAVAAVKLQTVENINRAIRAGITDIGDNHVQEFKDKFNGIEGNPRRHFIGHLQTNKVKYLIGKVDLYHSVDRINLAKELSKRSENAGITSDILLQINIGNEPTKGGFDLTEAEKACEAVSAMPALKLKGLMAMLPLSGERDVLLPLAQKMRNMYDRLKDIYGFEYLSMGMSGDWELCVEAGSNTIRIGTAVFGARNYSGT